MEVWKPAHGYPGYEVSDLGNARSLDRVIDCAGGPAKNGGWRGPYKKPLKGRLLALSPDASGYMSCSQLGRIHVLVMLTFVGLCPVGLEVRHLNGNKRDNRLDNLRYGTQSENEMDKVLAGTSNRGERHGMSKLTREIVVAIRSDQTSTQKELGQRYGVADSNIRHIKAGRRWSWLCQ